MSWTHHLYVIIHVSKWFSYWTWVLSRTFQFPGSKRVFSISLKLAGKPVQHLGSSFHLMRINSLRSEVDIKPQLSGFSWKKRTYLKIQGNSECKMFNYLVFLYVYVYIYMYIYIYMYMCISLSLVYVYTYVCHTHIYIYIYSIQIFHRYSPLKYLDLRHQGDAEVIWDTDERLLIILESVILGEKWTTDDDSVAPTTRREEIYGKPMVFTIKYRVFL